jgi:hypothetical protein
MTTDANIPDFTKTEARFGNIALALHQAGSNAVGGQRTSARELSDELTACPIICWAEGGAQYVVCKVAPERFCCRFFYSETEQYGTV